jgi:multiple sugar transport system permease protein
MQVQTMRKMRAEEARTAYLALLPSILILVTFKLYPLAQSLIMSFYDWPLIGDARQFVGLANYRKLFSDPDFILSLKNTTTYAIGAVTIGPALSLFLAVLLNRHLRLKELYRTAYFMPVVTSMVAVSVVWVWIYDPNYGPLNAFLEKLGVSGPAWLADPRWAMPAMIILAVWRNVGYDMVIFLAGLQDIPAEHYEAAEIDGANSWQKFIKITVPMLRTVIGFVLIMGTIRSFQVFGQIYVMTMGGPMNATLVTVYYLYRQAFEFFRLGYACSAAWVLFVIILTLTVIQNKVVGRESY